MKYIDELNPQQKEAALHTEGPCLILAGAGSGKTKTLVSRVAYLIEQKDIPPWKILAVTFTNKAANEMKERIHRILPDVNQRSLQFFTFHSFCARMLRQNAEAAKLKTTFTIYDDSEQNSVAKAILKKNDIDPKQTPPGNLIDFIEKLKNIGHYPNRKKALPKKITNDEMFHLYLEYESELALNNAVDFGGLITKCIELLETNPQIKEYYNQLFDYVLVDEYQDTNTAQFELMALLVEKKKNLTVIGDDFQSLYSWRGADINNILNFDTIYAGTKTFKLEQNYRSTKHIVEAASAAIKKNFFQKEKNLFTNQGDGEQIKVIQAFNGDAEAGFVAEKIAGLLRNKVKAKDIAIFYRTNAQSRSLEDALRRQHVQYQIIGGMKFYERKEIKDLISYLRAVINPYDEVAIIRALQNPSRGVGEKTLTTLINESRENSLTFWDYLIKVSQGKVKVSKKAQEGITSFVKTIETAMEQNRRNCDLDEIYLDILENSGYQNMLEISTKYEDAARLENLKELTSSLQNFQKVSEEKTLSAYLETVSLDSGSSEENKDNLVSLMTIHGSKGLEFDYVYVIGVEENIFPSISSINEGNLEEERRLFYVAVTRAKKELFLLHAFSRVLYGKIVQNPPSRFLKEIPVKNYKKFQI